MYIYKTTNTLMHTHAHAHAQNKKPWNGDVVVHVNGELQWTQTPIVAS